MQGYFEISWEVIFVDDFMQETYHAQSLMKSLVLKNKTKTNMPHLPHFRVKATRDRRYFGANFMHYRMNE